MFLALLLLRGQDVAQKRFRALDFACSRLLEALCSAFVCFQFRHDAFQFSIQPTPLFSATSCSSQRSLRLKAFSKDLNRRVRREHPRSAQRKSQPLKPSAWNLRLSRCRRRLLCRSSVLLPRLLRVRREDRVQRVAFLPWTELDDAAVADIVDQSLQDAAPQAGARHLASTEEDRGLDLVTLIQKTQHVVLLGLVVVIVHVDAELHFLDRDRLLVFLGLALFFLLLVQVFPVIHDAANRRLRCGGNLYQVEVTFAGHLERFERWQDADLFAFIVNHANFTRANALICADKSLVDTKPPLHVQRRGDRKV